MTRLRAGASLFVALTLACATAPKPAPAPGHAGDEPSAAEHLARWLAGLRDVSPFSAREAGTRAPIFGAAKGDIRDVYRKVAPATVLIRAGRGFGTGIVFDARGYVLTNHHVIANAESVDFKRRVEIERGHLAATGVMEPDKEVLTAWVLKSDPLLDLAVLKIDAPPKDLKALRVSTKDPVPGEPVSALGNGGIGLLWAIKDGEISSIGKLATHLAQIVGSECRVADDPAVAEACRSSSKSAALERSLIEKEVPGLVIQTSCTISPGDSGGPLVNRAGELVGVNAFLRSDPRAPVTSNFHIHVAEVRTFLKEVPAEPAALVPDPFELVSFGAWVDGDGDGKNDLYLGRTGALADLGQATPQTKYAFGARTMTADFALARVGTQWLAWYDVDGDGRFDRVVMDGAAGQPARAWKLDGRQLGVFVGASKLVDASIFGDEPRRARMSAVEQLVLEGVGLAKPAEVSLSNLPKLAAPITSGARFADADRDGRFDTLVAPTLNGTRYLFDPAQTQFGALRAADAQAVAGKGVAPVLVVNQGSKRWIFVKGALVLGLEAGKSDVVSRAWTADGTKELPEWSGRDAIHAVTAHFSGDEQKRLRMALGLNLSYPIRGEPPAGAFPHPVFDVGVDIAAEESDVPGLQWSAVSIIGTRNDSSALVFALDEGALKGVTASQREAEVRKGKGIDFAWVARDGWEWFLYDLDHDAQFDAAIIKQGTKLEGRRIAKDGTVTVDVSLTKPVQPALFQDGRAKALEKLAPSFFGGTP